MVTDLDPLHKHLTFMSPLSEARAERLVRFLAGGPGGKVVDVGCGWAELLLRAVAGSPHLEGVGVDLDADAVDHGRLLAEERGMAGRVRLITGDAKAEAPAGAASAVCIGASQVWAARSATDQPLDYALALRSLRGLVDRGGRVVYGEGIWSSPPTAAAVAPLAGRLDEFVSLAEVVEIAVSCGFMPLGFHEATMDEWDEFESGYSARYATWLADHPADHPDAGEVREMARRQRAANLGGYRGVLGMAYLELIAT
ncbi:MAG TPA: methyltransferase domain-containing protein [Acidimicrobiales bacterium]|nr:methyltransferase domain-containing protein [Acidimicrobiales bacterium]